MSDVLEDKPRSTARRKSPKGEAGATSSRDVLDRDDWLATARKVLISEGISAVKIDRLAKAQKVTRGGFYWRFKSRGELLNLLMQDRREKNNRATRHSTGPARRSSVFESL